MSTLIRVLLISSNLLLFSQCTHEDTRHTFDFGVSPNTAGETDDECGDGRCNPAESPISCEVDCVYCGDQVCQFAESATSCPADYVADIGTVFDMTTDIDMTLSACEDGICDAQENDLDCPVDCEDGQDMNIVSNMPTADPTGEVIGYVDEIQLRDGRWSVRGWACHQGWALL